MFNLYNYLLIKIGLHTETTSRDCCHHCRNYNGLCYYCEAGRVVCDRYIPCTLDICNPCEDFLPKYTVKGWFQ